MSQPLFSRKITLTLRPKGNEELTANKTTDYMKKMLFACALLAGTAAQAQKIDFNNSQNRTEDGFTAWTVGLESGAIQQTVDGITLTIARGEGSIGTHLMGEWWKDGVNKYSKLTSDGLTVSGKEGDEKYALREGAVALCITIEGLSAGEHSIMAYHNNPAGFNGAPLKVSVDGETLAEGIKQTNRAQTPSASGMSYVKFTATEGQPVTVVYETVPDAAVDYTQGYNTTSLYINALVLDRPNPVTTASDPTPAHQDFHYDGSPLLSWTAATSAVKHHVYIGTAPDALELKGTTTANSYQPFAGNVHDTYYWRIDEEDSEGNIYQGDTWSFRRARLAFPGAEGYGRYAIGGRGGSVYHVTSLDDDVNNPQPGTFRYGITRVSGPRTIVFDVSGTIELKSRLTCSDPYVTIAGQTAPGRGIMLRGNSFGISNDNIMRFVRSRLGYKVREDNSSRDGLGINGDYSIMDHCSVGWTIDEAFSSRNSKNITLQRTLISEALNIADHPNYETGKAHGFAATIGGDTGSYHHNLLAHNEGRNWSISGGLDGSGAYAGHHDMFNNVCYNWGGRATDGGTHEGNFVANYYKMGPATTQRAILNAQLEGTGSGSQSYYVSGNIRENLDGTTTGDVLGDTYKYTLSGGQKLDWTVFVDQPFFESHAVIETAETAYRNVLSDVGCNYAGLDNHDERMISETLSGTTSTVGSKSGKKGLIDRETDAEGFEGLNITEAQRPADFDTDGDGIPDWFEETAGWDAATPSNNAWTNDYTQLEIYLNWLAEPHFIILSEEATGTEDEFTFDIKPYFAGYDHFDEIILDEERPTNGTFWNVDADGTAHFRSSWSLIQSERVTVRQGDASLTRTFNFAVVDKLPQTEIANGISETRTAVRPAQQKTYNLAGQQVGNAYKGLVVKNGKKYIR